MRRLVIATTLAAMLGISGASVAAALPGDSSASRLTCVVVRPADESVCVNADVPKLPKLPKVPAPPLP